MKKIFFTIVGVRCRYGDKVLKPEMTVRLYDKIGDTAEGTVLYIPPNGILCSLNPETLLDKLSFGSPAGVRFESAVSRPGPSAEEAPLRRLTGAAGCGILSF